ncbi:MAG: DMT family transporter [Deltaproteobacteria bacterium]|nr:DMT family transporter [Deltaproteobacteria bacterium]
MSFGILLGIITALLTSGADALSKKVSSKESVYAVSMSRWLFSLPVLLVFNFNSIIIPSINIEAILWLIVVSPLELLAMILYIKAISQHDMSLVVPFLSLTPMFLLFTGYVFLGERVDSYGVIGVTLIVVGIYLMNISDPKEGITAPFKNILKNKGAIYVIIVAIIYTITSTIGKRIVTLVGPSFMSFWYLASLTIVLFLFITIKREPVFPALKSNFLTNISIGTFVGLAAYTLFYSYQLIPVSYAIALKRTSILFAVLWGKIFFNESDFGKRVVGTVIVLIGVAVIILKA